MVGDLGLDEASVDAAIEARQVYAEKQAESQAFDTFSAYLKEQDPTLTDEGVQDLIKDRETSEPDARGDAQAVRHDRAGHRRGRL